MDIHLFLPRFDLQFDTRSISSGGKLPWGFPPSILYLGYSLQPTAYKPTSALQIQTQVSKKAFIHVS